MAGHLTIISCGINPDQINQAAIDTILSADIMAGGKRLLDFFPDFTNEKVVLDAKTSEKAVELAKAADSKNVVVLASGDALFHGIGRRFSQLLPDNQLSIMPNITAMQALFSKVKRPWEETSLFSAHGTNGLLPSRMILAKKQSIIYCDHKLTASQAAAKLVASAHSAAKRKAIIAEHLGTENERITEDSLENLAKTESAALSILLVLSAKAKVTDAGINLGLPDEEFAHQNRLITHSEVRAIAISKLKLGAGIMWDLGAGSGSVSIEAASLCPDLTVHTIEKETERCADILKNIQAFGCKNVELHEGNVLDVIDQLPAPRSIFIGGGGDEISTIAEKAFEKLQAGGRLVISAVLLETKALLTNTLAEQCQEVISISIQRSKKLGNKRMLKSENTIDIYVYEKDYYEQQ